MDAEYTSSYLVHPHRSHHDYVGVKHNPPTYFNLRSNYMRQLILEEIKFNCVVDQMGVWIYSIRKYPNGSINNPYYDIYHNARQVFLAAEKSKYDFEKEYRRLIQSADSADIILEYKRNE